MLAVVPSVKMQCWDILSCRETQFTAFFYALDRKSTPKVHDLEDAVLARQFVFLKDNKTMMESSTISELK